MHVTQPSTLEPEAVWSESRQLQVIQKVEYKPTPGSWVFIGVPAHAFDSAI